MLLNALVANVHILALATYVHTIVDHISSGGLCRDREKQQKKEMAVETYIFAIYKLYM